jgi:hypothetical protein
LATAGIGSTTNAFLACPELAIDATHSLLRFLANFGDIDHEVLKGLSGQHCSGMPIRNLLPDQHIVTLELSLVDILEEALPRMFKNTWTLGNDYSSFLHMDIRQ